MNKKTTGTCWIGGRGYPEPAKTKKDKSTMNNEQQKIRAVIDTETTHLDETKGCIVELAIMPIDDNLQPLQDIEPFEIIIRPAENDVIDPIAMDINGVDIYNQACCKAIALEALYDWKKKHNIKAIYPIAQNWEFDSKFYKAFAKDTCLENLFYHRASDTQRLAQSINDAYITAGLEPKFERTKLQVLADYYGIDYSNAHRALADCDITRLVYIELLKHIKVNPDTDKGV
jgi:DNA polymerase III epsilon subunit-like protein